MRGKAVGLPGRASRPGAGPLGSALVPCSAPAAGAGEISRKNALRARPSSPEANVPAVGSAPGRLKELG